MRARALTLAAAFAVYVVAACATGGEGDTTEGGVGSPDSPGATDGPGHPHDGSEMDASDSFIPPPKDSGTDSAMPPTDSFIPPSDSFVPDVLPFDVIPFDVTLPKDASADAPFTDAGGGKVNCPLSFKYIFEAEIASSTDDAPLCSAGCTPAQCCFVPAGFCLKK